MNRVVQDPNQVGSGLRTISLRLRGTEVSGELEELGEETDGLVSSSKMRSKIKGLTAVKGNEKGVDILTDTGAYKSTYQIIAEIGDVWENMNDMDQAALLELMAGKNRSNIMAALLTNTYDLKGAFEDAADAEGSAYKENEAYLDSIQGRMDLFTNSLQTFWMNLLNSDMIKWVIDQGTWLINLLDTVPGKLSAILAILAGGLKLTGKFDGIKEIATSGAVSAKSFMSEFSRGVNKNPTGMGISQAISKNIKDVNTKINMRDAVASALGVNNLSEVGDLTKAQQKQATSAIQAAAASNKLGAAQTATTMATAGLTSASTMATTAFNGLKSAVIAHPFIAIAAAVLVAVAAIDKFTITAKEAADASHDKFNEISNAFSTTEFDIKNMEDELSNIKTQIEDMEGRNLSFTDEQELARLKAQRTELNNNLNVQKQILKSQEKVKNEAAVTAMRDFIKASNEGAESAEKTGKIIGAVIGGIATAVGIAFAPVTMGTSTAIGATIGGAIIGATAGGVVGSNNNAATINTYEDWYKTYTDAYKEKFQAARDAREKYNKDPGNMDKYDEWQKLEQEAIDVQSKMYDNLTQMQNYYSEIEYGQSKAMDKELDTWYNFLDKMSIDQNGADAKANALDRIFGENASDEIKEFKKEVDEVIKDKDNKFNIAAEIEGRPELQELENQLLDIGITTDEVSDYFRKTGEVGTKAFADLSGEITAAENAMTTLQNVLEKNTNEGYETRNTGLEEMKDLMEKGAIGSESKLWDVAKAMGFTYDSAKSIEANADALYSYIKVRDDWYQVDDDGEWGVSSANAFAKDIESAVKNSKELQKLDIKWNFDESTNTLDFDFNNMQFDTIVEALGKTKEAAGLTNEEFIDMITHLGQFYNVQWANGNDIVSYIEYLATTSASAKTQIESIEDPLKQLLGKKGLNSKEIEAYLTGNGSLKALPEDLQKAVSAYRELHKEMQKDGGAAQSTEVTETTNVTTTEKEGGISSKNKDFFTGDKSEEKIEQNVDVEVKAEEVDTTDVQEKTKEAIEKDTDTTTDPLKAIKVDEPKEVIESIKQIEDKDIAINAEVKGIDDIGKFAEFANGAKELSKIKGDIKIAVTADIDGTVLTTPEGWINNLKVFAEGAGKLQGINSFTVEITADVYGTVLDTSEDRISKLGELATHADKLNDIESFTTSITVDVTNNATDEELEKLEKFSGLISKLSPTPLVQLTVTANVASDAINDAITLLTNLSNSGILQDYNVTVTVTANTEPALTSIQNINNTVLDKKVLNISEEGSQAVLNALSSINKKTLNSKTVYVNYKTGTMPSIPSWPGGRDGGSSTPWPLVNGTAHAKGTTWIGGSAFAGGNWGASKTETALVGELGPEMRVRNGRWELIGQNGAEFSDVKKGDIIFNHKQTESLLENGYVTGRGRAYAGGTNINMSNPNIKPIDTDELANALNNASDAINEFQGNVANTNENIKENNEVTTKFTDGWFSKGKFKDGYQPGDISKTILGTATDAAVNINSGLGSIGEGFIDTIAYGASGFAKAIGKDEFADKTRDFIARDLLGEFNFGEKITELNPLTKQLHIIDKLLNKDGREDASILDYKTDSLIGSAGQLAGTAALQAIGVPWYVTSGVTSFGSGVESAFNKDATYGEAAISAAITAGAEILTEKIGGVKFGGKTLSDEVIGSLTNGMSNEFVKKITEFGVGHVLLGEGTEEVFSEAISRFGQLMTYEDDKTLKDMMFSKDAFDSYLGSYIGGFLLGEGSSAVKSIGSLNNISNGFVSGSDGKSNIPEDFGKPMDENLERKIIDGASSEYADYFSDGVGVVIKDAIRTMNEDYGQILSNGYESNATYFSNSADESKNYGGYNVGLDSDGKAPRAVMSDLLMKNPYIIQGNGRGWTNLVDTNIWTDDKIKDFVDRQRAERVVEAMRQYYSDNDLEYLVETLQQPNMKKDGVTATKMPELYIESIDLYEELANNRHLSKFNEIFNSNTSHSKQAKAFEKEAQKFIFKDDGLSLDDFYENPNKIHERAFALGYDGTILLDVVDTSGKPNDQYAVFAENQIRLTEELLNKSSSSDSLIKENKFDTLIAKETAGDAYQKLIDMISLYDNNWDSHVSKNLKSNTLGLQGAEDNIAYYQEQLVNAQSGIFSKLFNKANIDNIQQNLDDEYQARDFYTEQVAHWKQMKNNKPSREEFLQPYVSELETLMNAISSSDEVMPNKETGGLTKEQFDNYKAIKQKSTALNFSDDLYKDLQENLEAGLGSVPEYGWLEHAQKLEAAVSEAQKASDRKKYVQQIQEKQQEIDSLNMQIAQHTQNAESYGLSNNFNQSTLDVMNQTVEAEKANLQQLVDERADLQSKLNALYDPVDFGVTTHPSLQRNVFSGASTEYADYFEEGIGYVIKNVFRTMEYDWGGILSGRYKEQAAYFSNSADESKNYGHYSIGEEHDYENPPTRAIMSDLLMKNPYIVDAKGARWGNIIDSNTSTLTPEEFEAMSHAANALYEVCMELESISFDTSRLESVISPQNSVYDIFNNSPYLEKSRRIFESNISKEAKLDQLRQEYDILDDITDASVPTNPNEIHAKAFANGHDGVILLNVTDTSGVPNDQYVVFSEEQIQQTREMLYDKEANGYYPFDAHIASETIHNKTKLARRQEKKYDEYELDYRNDIDKYNAEIRSRHDHTESLLAQMSDPNISQETKGFNQALIDANSRMISELQTRIKDAENTINNKPSKEEFMHKYMGEVSELMNIIRTTSEPIPNKETSGLSEKDYSEFEILSVRDDIFEEYQKLQRAIQIIPDKGFKADDRLNSLDEANNAIQNIQSFAEELSQLEGVPHNIDSVLEYYNQFENTKLPIENITDGASLPAQLSQAYQSEILSQYTQDVENAKQEISKLAAEIIKGENAISNIPDDDSMKDIKGQINFALNMKKIELAGMEEELEGLEARLATFGAEPTTTEYNITGTGADEVQAIDTGWDAVPAVKTTDYTINKTTYESVVNSTPKKGTTKQPGAAGSLYWGVVNGTAHAGGNWGAPRTETALVGELGPEMVVRGDRWFTVGEYGAEFTGIQKGDIIFNHKQTEELLSNGYVTSRGKIKGGSAHAQGTAYAGGGSKYKKYTFSYDSDSGSVKKTSKNTSGSSSSGSSKNTQDAFEELFDWFEVRIEELQEDLDLLAAKLENAVSLSGKNNIIDSMIKKNKQELGALDKGYKLYSGYANKLLKKIPKAYRAEAKDGKIAIEKFYGKVDEKTLEAIKNYREWAQKAADLKVQIQEIRREITELSKQKLDNIIELFDNVESVQDARQSHYVDMAEYRDNKGWINSDKYYKQAIREEKNKRASNIKERNRLQAELDKAVKEGRIKVGSKEWYDAINAIHEVDAAIDENNANIEDYQNRINEINFDNFEKKLYRVSRIAEETQNLIDVLANKPSVDVDDEGNVSFTDEGIAQIGLYAQKIENAKKQSEMYAQQIDELNAMYARGEISYDEYLEKLDEYKDGQYEAIQAEQDAKDAIIELEKARVDEIKNGIDKQIEAYSELIDKKKEELDAEKDLYDFQRQTMDQAKNIADIQRQLAAISGDNSASANAQRKKLEAELAQAKQEQADSFYDRSVSNAQEALDNELELFTELREKEKENWDKWLENTDAVFAHAMETVTSSGKTIKNTIKDVAEEWDLQIADHIKLPWNNATTALQNTEKRLDGVIKKFDNAAAAADRHATKQIRDQKEQNDDIADDRQDPVKGLKVTAKAGTAVYDKNGNVIKTLGKNTTYTAGKTDSKTGRTQVIDSKGNVVGWVNSSSLDVDKNNQFKKGQEINAQNAPLYSSKTDPSGEYQGMTRYIVQAVDKKTGRVKAKSKNKNSKGKYVTGWFKMADVVITKQAPNKPNTGGGTGGGKPGTGGGGGNSGTGTKYYKKYTGNSGSIVDALKAIGVNSSFNNRKKIAKANGISNYSGTGTQNTKLLNLLKKGKLKKYAVGSKNIPNDQFALLHELGEELVLHAGANGKLEYLSKGSGVVPADLTSNLMEWGKLDPQSMLDQNRPSVGISPEVHATEINLNIQYGDMLKIENFKGDNPEDVAKIVAKQFEKHTKQLNQSLRKYTRG